MAWTTLVLSEGPMAVCVCTCVMDEGPYFSSQTRPDGWELRLVSFTPRSRHLGTRQMTFRPGTGQLGFCFCKKHHDQKINVKQLCKLSDVIVLPREKPSYNLRKITAYFQHNLHYAAVICLFFSLSLSFWHWASGWGELPGCEELLCSKDKEPSLIQKNTDFPAWGHCVV